MIAKETGWYAPELLADAGGRRGRSHSAVGEQSTRTPDGTASLESMVLDGIERLAREANDPGSALETAPIEIVPLQSGTGRRR